MNIETMSVETSDDAITCYLRAHVALIASMPRKDTVVYCGMEDFLFQHGRFWPEVGFDPQLRRGVPRMCFDNAFKLARRRKGLRYVEGLAYCGLIPVHHAWCVDDADRVLDNTWKKAGDSYFGIVIPIDYIQHLRRTTSYLCALQNPSAMRDIYTKPFDSTTFAL